MGARKKPSHPSTHSASLLAFPKHPSAVEGMDREQLSHNNGHERARVRSPMRLSEQVFYIRSMELARACGNPTANVRHAKPTRLDTALDHNDAGVRFALSQFVEDMVAVEGGYSKPSEKPRAVVRNEDKTSYSVMTAAQQKAGERLDFVRKRMGKTDLFDLRRFANMMAPVSPQNAPESMVEFGVRKSGLKDDRASEGVFIGCVLKMGERLYDLYRIMDLAPKLLRAA